MPTLERSIDVRMPCDQAEQQWSRFTSKRSQGAQQGSMEATMRQTGDGADPGTVYFNEVDGKCTRVTIQLDPEQVQSDTTDQKVLGQRVDGFLNQFKEFVEE